MQAKITILDAHVHIHDCFDVSSFLEHARNNFSRHAAAYSSSTEFTGVLLLTESYGANWYEKLYRSAATGEDSAWGDWRMLRNQETVSLTAVSGTGQKLVIVAGRQIVTAENLEILALGYDDMVEDGQPIDDVILAVQASNALCVLPWGFGKWTGNRGQIVRRILGGATKENFFIGDNAGRLAMWPTPAEFETAANKNIRILPGSDPLPFQNQESAVGQYGLIVELPLDAAKPFDSLRQYLLGKDAPTHEFGSRESLVPFVVNQISMQVRKFAS